MSRSTVLSDRVVAITASRAGADGTILYRWGTGCVVTGRTIITSAHVLEGAERVTVQLVNRTKYAAELDQRFIGNPEGWRADQQIAPDVALLTIGGPCDGSEQFVEIEAMKIGQIDRGASGEVDDARTIGMPLFAEVRDEKTGRKYRDTNSSVGPLMPSSSLVRGMLDLQAKTNPAVSRGDSAHSPWAGMSGAPVVVDDHLVGVVCEAATAAGSGAILVTPIVMLSPSRWGPGVPDPAAWWERLGVRDLDGLRVFTDTSTPRFPDSLTDAHGTVRTWPPSSPWAAWIPADWDPLGSTPAPLREDQAFRPDVLWARDPSPFRAVLADSPGGNLASSLAQSQVESPGHRSWHRLSRQNLRTQSSMARKEVLATLEQPAMGEETIGVVVDFECLDDGTVIDDTTRAVALMDWVCTRFPSDAVVLRIESWSAMRANAVAALVARRLRSSGAFVDAASRATSISAGMPGGVSSNALAVLLNLVRVRRQSLGLSADWPVFEVPDNAQVGADTATAVVRDLNDGISLPVGLDESGLLRHVRESAPEIWPALLRWYAQQRSNAGWYTGLSVASERSADLDSWMDVAIEQHAERFLRPRVLRGHLHSAVFDRVLIALRGRHELMGEWLSVSDSPLAIAIRDSTGPIPLDDLPIEPARRVLRYCEYTDPKEPVAVGFWIALASSPTLDQDRTRIVGVDPHDVLASAPPRIVDPATLQAVAYYRRLIRPEGIAQ